MAANLEISAESKELTTGKINAQLIERLLKKIEKKEKELEQAAEQINVLNNKVVDLETEQERNTNLAIARENELKADLSKRVQRT